MGAFLVAVLGLISLLELLVAEDEVEVLVKSLILYPFDGALAELLKTVHLSRVAQGTAAVGLLPYLLHLLGKVEVDWQHGLLELLRDEAPPLHAILGLHMCHLTITFLLYSLKYEPRIISLFYSFSSFPREARASFLHRSLIIFRSPCIIIPRKGSISKKGGLLSSWMWRGVLRR